MATIPHLPLSNSSFRSPTSIPAPFASSNYLFNKSKGEKDYRERTRIQFLAGWNDPDDEIFRWYRSQPYRRFQAIEYCKEKTGVQHEFIRVLLLNDQDDRVGSFCRIERVADIERRIEAITTGGTTSFDFVQTFDLDNPINPVHHEPPTSDAEVIAQIVFPRTLDLVNILAICYGIQMHPDARRYTLQQFNCYFFSWTIILCLARHTADWNGIIRSHVGKLQEKILEHFGSLCSSGNLTVWSVLLRVGGHDGQALNRSRNYPQILENILSELNSEVFMDVVSRMIRSLLWHDQDICSLLGSLQVRLDVIVRSIADPLLETTFRNSGMDFKKLMSILICGAFHSELTRLCIAKWRHNSEPGEQIIQELKQFYAAFPKSARRKLLKKNVPFVALLGLACPCYVFVGTVSHIILSSRQFYDREISIGRMDETENQPRKLRAVLKSIVQGPKFLYEGLLFSAHDIRAEYYVTRALHAQKSGLCPEEIVPPLNEMSILAPAIRILGESLNVYSARHSRASIDELRDQAAKTMLYVCHIAIIFSLVKGPMDKMWKLSFRDDVGSAIAWSILEIINQPISQSSIHWIPGSTVSHKSPTLDSDYFRLSYVEFQNRIRERIVQLGRWELQGTPIAQYMRHVPFGTPPKQSQAEMERAIENIWGTCGPLMT